MLAMRRTVAAGVLGVVVLFGAGCAGTPARDTPATGGEAPASIDVRDAIAMLALSMIGVPYRYGGADPGGGFDCSGLVYYAYTSHGQAVPRTSQQQFGAARKITLAQAAAGDLLFFQDQEQLSHVGIYLGDGRFVHAPSSGDTVRIANIDAPYYQRHLVAVGSLLP